MKIYLLASGDLRLLANQKCWDAQASMESLLAQALKNSGSELIRAHAYDPEKQHLIELRSGTSDNSRRATIISEMAIKNQLYFERYTNDDYKIL